MQTRQQFLEELKDLEKEYLKEHKRQLSSESFVWYELAREMVDLVTWHIKKHDDTNLESHDIFEIVQLAHDNILKSYRNHLDADSPFLTKYLVDKYKKTKK